MPADFQIAPAVSSDASGLISIRSSVVAEGEFLVAEPGEAPMAIDMMIARVRSQAVGEPDGGAARSGRCMLVARARHQVIGMVEVQPGGFRRNRHVGYLELMVRSDWRGQGVGRALMNRILDWATTSSITKVSLAVYAHNAPAIGLYRSLGFIEEGRRIGEYKFPDGVLRDDVLMALVLGGRAGREKVGGS